ncbi:MAG: bifunctional 4-hydroxy-2-oxoglutarate aldolase/2-dehydro-3-deoxy-phosphogluconate aldolase [Trueperaceae bacterium]
MQRAFQNTPGNTDFLTALSQTRVVAIVRGSYSVSEYGDIAGALLEGGLGTIEFTIEQPHALGAIRELGRSGHEGLWLGAGTVRTGEDAQRALEAGARYLVSPGFVSGVARVAREAGVVYLPGVLTPSEVETAKEAGCEAVKLFPARPLGPAYLKAIAAPLTGMKFIPTGGIGVDDAHEFLSAGATAVGLGSSLAGRGDSPRVIRERTRRLLAHLREASLGG